MSTPKRSNEEIVEEFARRSDPVEMFVHKDSWWFQEGENANIEWEDMVDWLRTILTEKDAEAEKARQDWLREEIVKLEGMKRYHPTERDFDGLSLIETHKLGQNVSFNTAIQAIIDRYKAELDQDKK